MNSTVTSNSSIENSVSKRYYDSSWDYKDANTKIVSHGIHTYPAMMIPQIARRLIEIYGNTADVLFDPFMGSGTSLVEAKIHPQFEHAYGIDINPLACLIGKVKSTPIDINELNKTATSILSYIEEDISAVNSGKKTIKPLTFKNIEFWFKPIVIRDLTIIKNRIDGVENRDIRDFLLVALSEVVRHVSNTRNSEFKLYRMSEKSLDKYSPNTFQEFQKRLLYNISQIENLDKEASTCQIHVLAEDTRNQISLPSESVDIIVSSPPYGDSKTTVAYGQFSRLSLEFLGYDESIVRKLDTISIGGMKASNFDLELESPTLRKEIKEIEEIDEKRALEVISFYQDFIKCAKEINRVMKVGGHICLVVGNRTVKKIKLSTDIIIVEFFLSFGNYYHKKTIIRNIPSKRMPKANSPTNIKGDVLSTMNEEYIIILEKIK